jgi:catechol 2,3-dioxygenase-like lactoylglutathione lyase family enzyme
MNRPRIRHIAINVQDRDNVAEYLKKVFGMEEKERGGNGTIYLSDGFLDVALISSTKHKWGINHFGFQVESIKAIERLAGTAATPSPAGVHAEFQLRDPEENPIDMSEEGWPV